MRRIFLMAVGGAMAAMAAASASALTPYLVDGDGDGVSDEIDDCPYSQPGAVVNAKGCPLRREDGDGDGVVDDSDDCPYSAPGAAVDEKGCALDDDFDGVPNGVDRCPATMLALRVDDQGCAAGEGRGMVAPSKPKARGPAPRATAPAMAPMPPPVVAPVIPDFVPPPRVPEVPAAVTAAVTNPTRIIATPLAAPAIAPSTAAPATAFAAETPELLLKFNRSSARLGRADLELLRAYAKVFARRLAREPAARLVLRGLAGKDERDAGSLAAARAAVVSGALADAGIANERVQVESGLGDGGASARRVEVKLVL